MKTYLLLICLCLLPLASKAQLQPVIDPSVAGKEVGGSHLLRLEGKTGEVFRYRVTVTSMISTKNADDLFKEEMQPPVKPEEKTNETTRYYLSLSAHKHRTDGTIAYDILIDSVNYAIENNGEKNYFSSDRISDVQNPGFPNGIYAGSDFGFIVDTFGVVKDVYGFFNITEALYNRLDDSLKTSANYNSLSEQSYSALETVIRQLFCLLPSGLTAKDSSYSFEDDVDHEVWRTLSFPMKKDLKWRVQRFEERDGRTYGVCSTEIEFIPTERIIDETEYKTTLPSYNSENKYFYYLDESTGMVAYVRATRDESYAMKIESKSPEHTGQSFATTHRIKVMSIVELLK